MSCVCKECLDRAKAPERTHPISSTELPGSVEKVQADDFVCLNTGGNHMYNCPACSGTDLMTWFSFCPNCGVKIEFNL